MAHVAANFSFQLKNKDVGSGGNASVVFPGMGTINIPTKDGNVTGEKSGAFSQGADGVAKVTWTVKLTVESYATNVKFTDTLAAKNRRSDRDHRELGQPSPRCPYDYV